MRLRIKNTNNRYGIIAIILHWVIAILIIALLVFGIYMVQMSISLQKLKLYGWHKEFGMLVLMLVMVRFVWRLSNITPTLSIPLWEKVAARTVHGFFFVFMFAIPITGWLMTSAAGLPVSFFGLFVFPNLVVPNEHLMKLLQEIHKWLGYGLIAIIILHTCAALKHHFVNKDDILRRMLS